MQKNIFNKLQELRLKYNYSIRDIAKKLNCSGAYYWQIENRERNLSYEKAIEISFIFNCKPDDIFYDEFKKN